MKLESADLLHSQLLNVECARGFLMAVANLLRQQPQRFNTFRFSKRAENLIQLHVAALGENFTYPAEIPGLEFFQPNYYRDMFAPREVQEFMGHGNQS